MSNIIPQRPGDGQRPPPCGPFGTEREALAASLWHAEGGPSSRMSVGQANKADLDAALSGIPAGAYDQAIAAWLAQAPPAAVTVITGWVRRARRAGRAQRDEQAAAWLAQMADALAAAREAITVPPATEWDDDQDKEERTAVLLARVRHLAAFLGVVVGRDSDLASETARLREQLAGGAR